MIDLKAGDYRLQLSPELGGSISRFEWRDRELMRSRQGPSILDAACFPLVPFSNRIASGHFLIGESEINLPPNFPSVDAHNPLHGFGWLSAWIAVQQNETSATLVHDHGGGNWPWPYRALQSFHLTPDGLVISLRIKNAGDQPMPAGLGLHPYFPRDKDTRLLSWHRGEWTNEGGLPHELNLQPDPVDWWHGDPVGLRIVDTVYTDRHGPITITWPSRSLELSIIPDPLLRFTSIYVPDGEPFFCVEPVTHETNALNRPGATLSWCAPKCELGVSVRFSAKDLN